MILPCPTNFEQKLDKISLNITFNTHASLLRIYKHFSAILTGHDIFHVDFELGKRQELLLLILFYVRFYLPRRVLVNKWHINDLQDFPQLKASFVYCMGGPIERDST